MSLCFFGSGGVGGGSTEEVEVTDLDERDMITATQVGLEMSQGLKEKNTGVVSQSFSRLYLSYHQGRSEAYKQVDY